MSSANSAMMAAFGKRRNAQEEDADASVVFRRPTTDLKDVQDILKSVVQTSESFINRHTSINEEDDSMDILQQKSYYLDSPPLILKKRDPPFNRSTSDSTVQDENRSNIMRTPSPTIETDGGESHKGQRKPRHSPVYGEIIVLGSNGHLPCQPLSPKMSHQYILRKQPKATGVSRIVRDPKDIHSLSRVSTHTVSMTMAKSNTCRVMEFGPDQSMDMFQIGRSTDSAIDMVVVDTILGEDGKRIFNSSSTISRYSCRILCERNPPYTARIYAAAFDMNGKIQLSPMAPTWTDAITGTTDGLTTNGIAILRPVGVFESGVNPDQWHEITVMGNVRQMRPNRLVREPGAPKPEETNVLTDGCLIDLCGITLMWRTALGLDYGPSDTLLRDRQQALNVMTPQCPVNFLTLHFKSGKLITSTTAVPDNDETREPWIYTNCGHVLGQHCWKSSKEENNSQRTCPICRKVGPYIKLELGHEKAFFVDNGSLTHTFVPCGHVTTEQTAKYWSKVRLPHLTKNWSSCCPFCSVELDSETPYIKLYFS